jgi:DNA repair protein RadC
MVYFPKSSVKKINSSRVKNKSDLLESGQIKNDDNTKGHRLRVKEKFKKQNISNFSNVEIIEALLFFCNIRRDVKNEAKVLDRISSDSILKFLFLTEDDIQANNIKYIGENLLLLNKIILELTARFFKEKITEFTFYNIEDIKNYLIVRSGFLSREELRILYLNSKNKLIDDDIISRGTINQTAIYIREVVALALKKAAMSIIISHNHPSGDVSPSRDDIKVTYNLKQALDSVCIKIQDHIIISRNRYFSFKQEGLL